MSENTEDDIETIQDEEEMPSTVSDGDLVLISTAVLSNNSSLHENVATLSYSFGYNCKKLYNLILIEDDVLVFASGNLIHFFCISMRVVTTRRSSGEGIGSITKNPNPNYNYLTIAENGRKTNIYIYKYPEMELISLLKKGTTHHYTLVAYSTDGELLGSQGGAPDYTLTIWDWKRQEIKLRAESFSSNVLNISFSPWIPEQLTTSGIGHIKFWKMSNTFTGLKLQSVSGRFGKSEICDILGIYSLPDEKVLSGCEWGNILVWDEGLIKFEVCKKNRKPCHQGQITQIFMNGEEVTTVGTDGFIRVWFWETVELADPPEDDPFVEIEPMHEFKIGEDTTVAEILKIVKNKNQDNKWYAQDGNGGIWSFGLNTDGLSNRPEKILHCHSGEIVGLGVSPFSTHVATLGEDGYLYLYDYNRKKMIFHHKFISAGRDLIWLPIEVDPTGTILVLGFADGVTRVISLNPKNIETNNNPLQLVQAIKCHHLPITKLSINLNGKILVSGSEDKTVFVHEIAKNGQYITLNPIGFVKVPEIVTYITWHPEQNTKAIIGCKLGFVCEVSLPESPVDYTDISYHLERVELKTLIFISIKSDIERNQKIQEIAHRRAIWLEQKGLELQKLKADYPELEINEREFFADLVGDEETEKLEPTYIPKITSPVLWLQYTPENSVWLCMGDYDAGYVYEYNFEQSEPVSCIQIPDAENIEVNCFATNDHYLIFGMNDGSIRIYNRKKDFKDFSDSWKLYMHDNLNGKINSIKFSYDKKHFFSIGADGNFFVFDWNLPVEEVKPPRPKSAVKLLETVADITDPKFMSLEQQKQKEDADKRRKIALDNKNEVLGIIANYKEEFEEIMRKNMSLPESQRLKPEELILDIRITENLQEKLAKEMEVVREKQAFEFEKTQIAGKKLIKYFIDPLEDFPIEVVGIRNKKSVYSFRIKKLDEEYLMLRDELEDRIRNEAEKRKAIEEIEESCSERLQDFADVSLRTCESSTSSQNVESFLNGLSATTIESKLESKMRRLLSKYRERKAKEMNRKKEWDKVNAEKPNPDVDHPDDVKAIEDAQETIGDYKLKSDSQYEATEQERENTFKKYNELLNIREEIFNIRNGYNKKVFALRTKKCELIQYIKKKMEKLKKIHSEIKRENHKHPNITVEFVVEKEFPERNFQLETYFLQQEDEDSKEDSDAKTQAQTEADEEKVLMELQRIILGIGEQKCEDISSIFDPKLKEKVDKIEAKTSEWEEEMRNLRIKRNQFEQNQIIQKINNRIEEYDQDLEKVSRERYQVEVQAKFKELYLLTLNQELWTLKDFEFHEDKMVEEVDEKIVEKRQLNLRLGHAKNDVEMYKRTVEELENSLKAVDHKFYSTCVDSKFMSFLRKIYRKKLLKTQRTKEVQDDDADQISGSESSDSDSEEGTYDVNQMNLDETTCPKGCDPKLYELAFQLRHDRREIEKSMREKEKQVEKYNEEVDFVSMKLEETENELEERKLKLMEFRQEKQKVLNDIDTLVILKMDQLQYFKNQEEFEDIDNTLLFNSNNVTKLYARVGQLALETIEVKRKHRINVIHLAKMKTDIKHMEKQISDLKDETNQAMLKKFGRIINLDDLEETILRRFTYDMRANIDDIKREYQRKISDIKKIIASKQEEYNRIIQEGTEKLNILTVLEEEKNYLRKIINQQKKTKDRPETARDIGRDLDKLKEISRHQKDQIEMLQREIRALSLKTKPFSTHPDHTYNIAQIGEDKCFEESFSSHHNDSQITSSRTTPDKEIQLEISNLITKFLDENFKEKIKENELMEIQENLTKYLTNVAVNFSSESKLELLPHVAEDFKKFLPHGFESYVPPAKVAILFQNVVKNFNIPEIDVNPCVILREVISSTIESQIFFDKTFSQDILTEILKQLVVTLKIEDIMTKDSIAAIVEILKEISRFDFGKIDADEVVKTVNEVICLENLEDEIEDEAVGTIVEKILGSFK